MPSGLPMALGAYFIWGLLPLYLKLVRHVPALEFIGWRILWTLPFCLLIVAARRQGPELRAALGNWSIMRRLGVSALLIAFNWTIYVFAVQGGHVFAASLGYYINPLANVLAGTLFLQERLTRRQWAAVGIATAGVTLLAWGARDTLWISLALAVSFCGYGLVRKVTPVGSLPGLTIESMWLIAPAVATTTWFAASPAGSSFGHAVSTSLLIVLGGVITAVPLLLFAIAARRMDYSLLGMVQFIAPTLVFITGLTVYGEPLRPVQLACFALIWIAIAVFVWDLVAQRRAASAGQAPA